MKLQISHTRSRSPSWSEVHVSSLLLAMHKINI